MKANRIASLKLVALSTLLAVPVLLAPRARAAETQTLSGEIVDVMCYVDHGAKGSDHSDCAQSCIQSGGPVGLLTKDNQLYLVIGHHKPMNDQLAQYAAKTVTLKGKVVERNGMKMIENAELQK